jgi:hypothetical protein
MPLKTAAMLNGLIIAAESLGQGTRSKNILTTCSVHQHILDLIHKRLSNRAQARKVTPVSPVCDVHLLAYHPRILLGHGTAK